MKNSPGYAGDGTMRVVAVEIRNGLIFDHIFVSRRIFMPDHGKKDSKEFSPGRVVLYGAAMLIMFYILALSDGSRLREIVFERGHIPHIILLASAWAMAILMGKLHNLRISGKHNEEIRSFIRKHYDRFLSVAKYAGSEPVEKSEGKCLECGYERKSKDEMFFSPLECPRCGVIYKKVADLFSKQESELRDFLNLLPKGMEEKRISQMVRDCFEVSPEFALNRCRILSDLDAQDAANSYRVPQALAWAVPMLGFLGTVWGIAQSLSNFTGIMGDVNNIGQIKESLGAITGGLGVAFDTTLLGIFFAIIITGFMAYLQRRENKSLDRFDRTALNLMKTLSIREKQPRFSRMLTGLEKHTRSLVEVVKQNKITADDRKVLELAAQSISGLGDFSGTLRAITGASRDLTTAVKELGRPREFRIIQE